MKQNKKDYITLWLPPTKRFGLENAYPFGTYQIERTAHWRTLKGKKIIMYAKKKYFKRTI